jgi:hypothetical protein
LYPASFSRIVQILEVIKVKGIAYRLSFILTNDTLDGKIGADIQAAMSGLTQ